MSYHNYMKWTAIYPKWEIVEDQQVASHWLKLAPQDLVAIEYRDEQFRYGLDCRSGLFYLNERPIKIVLPIQYPHIGAVNAAILTPSQEYTHDGIAQYKHCSLDSMGDTTGKPYLGTYNLSFRKTIDDKIYCTKMVIDGATMKPRIEIQVQSPLIGLRNNYKFDLVV